LVFSILLAPCSKHSTKITATKAVLPMYRAL
jgi:hypothetical protein